MTYGRIRRGRMAADAFTQIANGLFRDPHLSAKAKGIFGFIATHRDGYGVTPELIAEHMADGPTAVKTALQELERRGYLRRERERHEDGRLGASTYYITDAPEQNPRSEPKCDFPPVDEPPVDEPTEANRAYKNNRLKNTRGKNTSHTAPPAAAGDPGDETLGFDIPRAPAPGPNPVQVLVAAYADGVRGTASRALLGSVGKNVKRLLSEGIDPALILAAVQEAAPRGRRDLDAILAAPGGATARWQREQDEMFAAWELSIAAYKELQDSRRAG